MLFVGATRARRSLAVQGGYVIRGAEQTESGRCYRPSSKFRSGYQVQVGLAGDLDPFSVARLVLPINSIIDAPVPFPCVATLEKGTWMYRLTTVKGRSLGSVSQRLSSDLMEIGRAHPKRPGFRSPERIDGLHVLGYGTAVGAPGDERLAGAKGAAASSGFWLVPQITGLPMAFLR